VTPARAGGTVLERTLTVNSAIYYDEALVGLVVPLVTIFGLRRHPSRTILLSFKALKTAARTFSVT